MTDILTSFKEDFPEIIPRIIITNYAQLINMLNDKQLDVVFGTKDMMKGFFGYAFKKIQKMYTYVVVSNYNSLSLDTELSFTELDSSRFITLYYQIIPFKYGSKIQEKIQIHSQNKLDIVCEND